MAKKVNLDIDKDIKNGQQKAARDYAIKADSFPCFELLRYITRKAAKEAFNLDAELKAEGYDKPNKEQRVGKFISTILDVSNEEECGRPLRMLNGKPCYYNGRHWKQMQDLELKTFFSKAAKVMGIDGYTAMYPDFLNKSFDSFLTATYAVTKPRTSGAILNCGNGTLFLDERGNVELRPFNPEDGLMYVLPYDYDETATAPKWEKFLSEVLPEAADRLNLAEFCGSCFSGIRHERLAYLYGATGRNGKTTAKDIISAAFGLENVSNASLDSLTDNNGTGHASRAALEGKLLNACGEIEAKITSSSLLKQLATREALSVRPPFEKYARVLPEGSYARLMFCCNDLPTFTSGAGSAEKRRFLFIEFKEEISQERAILDLDKQIISAELPGVLNWMIDGLRRLIANEGKFTYNPHAEAIADKFLENSNSVFAYCKEMGIIPDNAGNRAKYSGLYTAERCGTNEIYNAAANMLTTSGRTFESYATFCENAGLFKVKRGKFFAHLAARGFKKQHTMQGSMFFFLALTAEGMDEEENATLF